MTPISSVLRKASKSSKDLVRQKTEILEREMNRILGLTTGGLDQRDREAYDRLMKRYHVLETEWSALGNKGRRGPK